MFFIISEKIKSKYFQKSKFALLIKNKNENLAKILIKGYHINEENERSNNYRLEEKIRNIEDLQIKNGAMDKNEKLLNMFIESIVSLNSWKNSKIENEILRKINWNIDKKEEDSVVPQYVFINTNKNLPLSQTSLFSKLDTEDEDDANLYKLGICRTFISKEIKSNIVKKVNDNIFKVYSQCNPNKIREICKNETIPENYEKIIDKYNKDGYKLIGFAGKLMKMSYLNCQKIEQSRCETNMVFLGFVVYRVILDGYKSSYS